MITGKLRRVCGQLHQAGESFSFCFDSGAECSLINQSLVPTFLVLVHIPLYISLELVGRVFTALDKVAAMF